MCACVRDRGEVKSNGEMHGKKKGDRRVQGREAARGS